MQTEKDINFFKIINLYSVLSLEKKSMWSFVYIYIYIYIYIQRLLFVQREKSKYL